MRTDLFEMMAALEHDRWSGWMKYMLANLNVESLIRWVGQMGTDYFELPDHSRESDRDEVRKTLALMASYEDSVILRLVNDHRKEEE